MLTLVCMDWVSALCLEHRFCLAVCKFGRYPSTRSFPLLLISHGPSKVTVLSHTLTAISIAFRRLSGWVCHEAKALPGPLAVLRACVIEWLEWVGAIDNKGGNIKTWGDDMITPLLPPPPLLPLFTPLSTSPSLFLLFLFLSYPRFPCTEPVPRTSVNQKWHVTPTPQWCADKRVLE